MTTPREKAREEILQAEKSFAQAVKEQGQKAAFLAFAADHAVLIRNGKLVQGKSEIAAYFDEQTVQNVQLAWEADYIDAAESGDMGYTHGHFVFDGTDREGKHLHFEGIFHTVWKKNSQGTWQYVWD